MVDEQPKVYFFAYSEEKEQIAQIHAYLVENGAKINPICKVFIFLFIFHHEFYSGF